MSLAALLVQAVHGDVTPRVRPRSVHIGQPVAVGEVAGGEDLTGELINFTSPGETGDSASDIRG